MWLMDHQMNLRVAEQFGENVVRLPLKKSAAIVHGNALRIDWNEVVPAGELDYILGNPPFIGHHYQNAEQKADQAAVMHEIPARGVLDFVANWYVKAADYIQANPRIACAFVSTNSITQGEQVGLLWPLLLSKGVRIHFAHRTFQWNNEARGQAAVHCVIVGFGLTQTTRKLIFEYESPRSDPVLIEAANINPYMVDAPDVVITNRSSPLCNVPTMSWGNKPTDGGHFILSPEERSALLEKEPAAAKFIRRYMSGGDFINGLERYCLWLPDATPQELKALPEVMKRVDAVRQSRLASKAATTREYAKYPTRFRQIAQPDSDYLAIPEVSSERRAYIPIAFLGREVICSNKIQFVPEASLYHFGVLISAMHMAWVRSVCGRLKSDLSYSNTIVYNNFPWPDLPPPQPPPPNRGGGQGDRYREALEAAPHDALTMPPALVKAHAALARAVDAAYLAAEKASGRKAPKLGTDAERVAFLFERYQALVSLLPADKSKKTRKKRAAVPD